MLNAIWAVMLIIGIVYGSVTGNIKEISNTVLSSANDAVSLCITMLGVMSVWTGIMEVARSAGLIEGMTRKMSKFIQFLFPRIPQNHPARDYIATNIIANVLGLGWAATPAGLKAMESLKELNHGSKTASNEMCAFLIINISSLQLIPVNMIAYRSQYGSVNPAMIVGPALCATLFSTIVSIIFIKLMNRSSDHTSVVKGVDGT
jgi:spore maturation protein A